MNAFVYHYYFSFPGLVTVLTVSDKLVSFHICHYCFLDFKTQLNLLLFQVGTICADLFFLLNFTFTIKFKPTSVAFFLLRNKKKNFCSYFHMDSHLCRLSYAKENTRKLSKKKPPGRGRQGPLSQLHSQYFPIYQNGLPWAVKKKG